MPGKNCIYLFTVMITMPRKQCFAAAVALTLLTAGAAAQSGATRTLTGTVVDEHHKPLSGAVVQVQNEDTKAVESFVTDRVGHFQFHRLAAATDYSVWAREHGHQSKAREISKFNAKNPVVITLEIKE